MMKCPSREELGHEGDRRDYDWVSSAVGIFETNHAHFLSGFLHLFASGERPTFNSFSKETEFPTVRTCRNLFLDPNVWIHAFWESFAQVTVMLPTDWLVVCFVGGAHCTNQHQQWVDALVNHSHAVSCWRKALVWLAGWVLWENLQVQ